MDRREFFTTLGAASLLLASGERRAEAWPAAILWPQDAVLRRIAFGSCAHQDEPQPIWDSVLAADPDIFLFIGDTVYGDTYNMQELRAQYRVLAGKPGYKRLRQTKPILAVWDDHDYGWNDAGADYPKGEGSKKIFLDFFGVPKDSPRWRRPGLYDAQVFGPPGKRVQILLLDLRSFRSPLNRVALSNKRKKLGFGPYVPRQEAQATMLGEEQWTWLAGQLETPAELRLVVSTVQVANAAHGWEAWGQFPQEQRRLLRLIESTRAGGVVFLSGDVHWGELSKVAGGPYPLYDFTSSALNQRYPAVRNLPNPCRVGTVAYPDPNFGIVEIDWASADPVVELRLHDVKGERILGHRVVLSELQPEAGREGTHASEPEPVEPSGRKEL